MKTNGVVDSVELEVAVELGSTTMSVDELLRLAEGSDRQAAFDAVGNLDGVDHVDLGPHGLLISVSNGAAAVSPVAVALDAVDADVVELTLRTPTLDDVFLELTGDRIEVSA